MEFYCVGEVMQMLGVGKSKAYAIIAKMNGELEAAGWYVPKRGQVDKTYFHECFYGVKPVGKSKMPIETRDSAKRRGEMPSKQTLRRCVG